MFDCLIRNVQIADGTGDPLYAGSVGIKDGKIAAVNPPADAVAAEVIDGQGKVLSPGFVDVHTHNDIMLRSDPVCLSKLAQGITTQVVGNCGFSAAPLVDETVDLFRAYAEPSLGKWTGAPQWHSFDEYLQMMEKMSFGSNVASLVGNGTVRMAVKGFDRSPFTPAETDRAVGYLTEAMEAGAVGMSMGLTYTPENYYSTEELLPLCSVAAKYGRPVTVHMRGEGDSLFEAVDEMLYIAEKTGIALNISHMKAAGKNNWGKMAEVLERLDAARARGIDVTGEVYSYTACYSQFPYLMPPWAAEGGVPKAVERVRDPALKAKIKAEMERPGDGWDCMIWSTGWDKVIIALTDTPECRQFEGKTVAEVAAMRGQDPTECALDIFAENNGIFGFMFFFIDEGDIERILRWEHSFSASDSTCINEGVCHPRVFGNSVRLLSRYVREKKTLSLEQAIYKLTHFPAKRLGLKGKGLIREGMDADLVLFDPETIRDRADYENARQYPEGILRVIVDGKTAMKDGEFCNVRAGRLIRAR